jgi:hypothetical protein
MTAKPAATKRTSRMMGFASIEFITQSSRCLVRDSMSETADDAQEPLQRSIVANQLSRSRLVPSADVGHNAMECKAPALPHAMRLPGPGLCRVSPTVQTEMNVAC